ncbi:MAG: mechanosensitive ion channel [SAR324 cluster bacterium]|nr:mechanosensitive ion channel [SAR324 cluster bacterium]
MNQLSGIFEELFDTVWFDNLLQMLLICCGVAILVIVVRWWHRRLTLFLPGYARWYPDYSRFLERSGILLVILTIILGFLETHWIMVFVFGGALLISLGLAFHEILVNILSYPSVQRSMKVELGDDVDVLGQQGTIIKKGMTHLVLRGIHGEKIVIPNRKIFSDVFAHHEKDHTLYHFMIDFPVLTKLNLGALLDYCQEIALLSAYRSLEHPPKVSADLKEGKVWIRCDCYTTRKQYVAPYRTFILKELSEKTSLLSTISQQQTEDQNISWKPIKLNPSWGPDQGGFSEKAPSFQTSEGYDEAEMTQQEAQEASTIEFFNDDEDPPETITLKLPTQEEVDAMDLDQLNELSMSGNETIINLVMVALEKRKNMVSPQASDRPPSTKESLPTGKLSQELIDEMNIDQLNELIMSGDEQVLSMAMLALEKLQTKMLNQPTEILPSTETTLVPHQPAMDSAKNADDFSVPEDSSSREPIPASREQPHEATDIQDLSDVLSDPVDSTAQFETSRIPVETYDQPFESLDTREQQPESEDLSEFLEESVADAEQPPEDIQEQQTALEDAQQSESENEILEENDVEGKESEQLIDQEVNQETEKLLLDPDEDDDELWFGAAKKTDTEDNNAVLVRKLKYALARLDQMTDRPSPDSQEILDLALLVEEASSILAPNDAVLLEATGLLFEKIYH